LVSQISKVKKAFVKIRSGFHRKGFIPIPAERSDGDPQIVGFPAPESKASKQAIRIGMGGVLSGNI